MGLDLEKNQVPEDDFNKEMDKEFSKNSVINILVGVDLKGNKLKCIVKQNNYEKIRSIRFWF